MLTRRIVPFLLLSVGACGQEIATSDEMPVGVDDSITTQDAMTASVAFGTRLLTTASNLNLRKGPSTSYAVRVVMPNGSSVRVVQSQPSSGWYNVNYKGIVGWASGSYLKIDLVPNSARQKAVARALSGRGFSYRWGGGAWNPSSQSPGSCSGSCPNCTHSGANGADCSGFVAKAWVVPPSNTPLTLVSHPYSTYNFRYGTNYWSPITRGNAKEADSLVYHSSGSGHIVLFISGDPWGSMQTAECRGCSAGCVYNTRTCSSSYIAIHRNGY
jgi:hypothetical protein